MGGGRVVNDKNMRLIRKSKNHRNSKRERIEKYPWVKQHVNI